MGQQQLLLLVLATVIVGLATVAGIQAFSEGQQQAAQDALVQRANSIATDLAAAYDKPSQLGGVDFSSKSDAASAIGLSSASGISAGGAGNDAGCDITVSSGTPNTATVDCGLTGANSGDVEVDVTVNPGNDDPVGDPTITVSS